MSQRGEIINAEEILTWEEEQTFNFLEDDRASFEKSRPHVNKLSKNYTAI